MMKVSPGIIKKIIHGLPLSVASRTWAAGEVHVARNLMTA